MSAMRSSFGVVLFLAVITPSLPGQEPVLARAGLPRAVAARLTAIMDDPETRRVTDQMTLAGMHVGNVVVTSGPLILAGRIEGELVAVHANIEFQAGSEVTGDVTFVNGQPVGLENAIIGGTVTVYNDGFGPFDRAEKVYSVNRRTRRVYREDDNRNWGHSSFTLRTGWNYNRVEGLPVMFGPSIETAGRNPTRIEALAIWRTEVSSPFDTDELGYVARAEQFFGGHRSFRLGASLRSVIDPIEDWQLTNTEASLATFVLHEDYRDYFEREGWSAYARVSPRGTGFSATVEYRDEDHSSQPARDPWTIFDNNDRWRFQPLVAEGRFRSLNGILEWDRRDDEDFPSAGFLLRGTVTSGLGGALQLPATTSAPGFEFDEEFSTAFLDARIYRRVGRDATLSFRVVGGGSLLDQAVPPQFQRALGGAGSLPGYSLFRADCRARVLPVQRLDDPNNTFYPYYGCDRSALFSAEYRGGFDFHFGGVDFWDDTDDEWDFSVDSNPNWIVFFDAARGWASTEAKQRGAADTETLYDVGAGILIGDLGIYGAAPLTGSDRAVKFFVRLGPRF